jgi:hypothetical protein
MALFISFMGIGVMAPALVAVRTGVGVVDHHIAGIGAVADNGLAAAASVLAVAAFIGVVVAVRLAFIDDHFVALVQVIAPQQGGTGSGLDPLAIGQVDILPFRYIIVGFDVGQVIIFYVIVTGRAPLGLVDDIDVDLGAERKTYQGGQKECCPYNSLFHFYTGIIYTGLKVPVRKFYQASCQI